MRILNSFDVFDTCVTRMYAHPRDLFYELGLRVAPASSGESARERFARRFQRARIRAEKLANWSARRRGHAHASIDAIYQKVNWFIRLDRPAAELIEAELTLEEESLYPIEETMLQLNALRAAGHRILFISDMYIPASMLRPMLERMGVMEEGDRLYVSCDIGVSKHNGKLFQHVLQAEGLRGEQLQHTGDNAHADIRMAEKLGILTRHFTAAHLTEHETRIAGSRLPRHPGASRQAGFSRRCRLAMHLIHGNPTHVLDDVIFSVIVPFLLAYVLWILDDARKRGIQRLYFVARDGEVLLKIARELKPDGIELRYLYGSRRAWLPPSISTDDVDWKRLLAVAGNANAPVDITARAGLSEVEQASVRVILSLDENTWRTALAFEDACTFIDTLTANPRSRKVLLDSVAAKREAALHYLRQEGLMDGVNWALVDAGWSLNGQAALKRMLSSVSPSNHQIQGYYIGLARDCLPEARAGRAYAFCPPPGSIFSRRRVVLEHCFLPASHASTCSYFLKGGHATPDFSADSRNNEELEYALRLHTVASASARLLKQQPAIGDLMRRFRTQLTNSAAGFICAPGVQDAIAYSMLTAVADMRQEREFSRSLCRPLSLADVWTTMGMAFSRRMAFKSPAWMWLEGSIALSPSYVAFPLRFMLRIDDFLNRIKSLRFPRCKSSSRIDQGKT